MRGIADIDLVWVSADEERVLFGVDGLAKIGASRSFGTRARRVNAVRLLSGNTVVPRSYNPVVLIY
jgi:hypothetical protein